ncbi:hypothetical protein ISS07_02140 [Candidatus Woesearchaeota archaeon]|nr:hypothetical protein [Candidatus Woesearchaeota archaeon]
MDFEQGDFPVLVRSSLRKVAQLEHYHTGINLSSGEVKDEGMFLDSVLNYHTARTHEGKIIHLIHDFNTLNGYLPFNMLFLWLMMTRKLTSF